MSNASKSLKNNVEKILVARGWSQTRLAKGMEVPQPQVSNWLTGKTQPGLDNLEKMASTLGVPLFELLKPETIPLARIPSPVITSHDVVGFLRKGLNDSHVREGMIKALSGMAWDQGEFGLTPAERSIIGGVSALDDEHRAALFKKIEMELAAFANSVDQNQKPGQG